MYVSKRLTVALLTASALAGSATTAVTALADHGQGGQGPAHRQDGERLVMFTSLAPSVPTDPALLGATAGGVPWVLRSGEAKLRSDGRLMVRIRGLLIPSGPAAGTTGPVKTVSASLYCGASSAPVGTSASVPLSSEGDARVTAMIAVPSKCQVPALLIHPNGALGLYISTSGFARPGS